MRIVESRRNRIILGRTLRQHIGGRWAISLIGYLVIAPFTLITLASDITEVPTSHQWALWVVAAVAGYLALGATLLLANLTAFRGRAANPVPILWVALLGSLVSVVRAEVNAGLVFGFDLSDIYLSQLPLRLVTNVLFGAILWPLMALILSLIDSYRAERRLLIIQAAELHGERMRASGQTRALELTIRESITGEFTDVIASRDADRARSMSHRMWASTASASAPRLHLRSLLGRVFTHNPYSALPVIAIWGLSTWGSSAEALGAQAATVRILICIVTIVLVFRMARAWTERHPHRAALIFVASMTVVLSVVGPITAIIFDPDARESAPVTLANCLWLTSIVVAVSFIRISLTSSEEILEELRKDVQSSEVELLATQREEQRIRSQLAARLHGSVQSRLLTAAALLDQPSDGSPRGRVDDALANIAELLDDPGPTVSGLRAGLDFIADPWQPLMSVTIAVDDDVLDEPGSAVLMTIAQEALSNAFRHGGAGSVSIHVSAEGSSLCMTVIDDGTFPDGLIEPGLGSALMDSLVPLGWHLGRHTEGGAILTAHVSLGDGPVGAL